MKIWTSYYSRIDDLRQLGFTDFIAISGYIPEFYQNVMNVQNNILGKKITFRRLLEFSPKKDWFFDWKNGKLDNEKYVELYTKTVLNQIDKKEILQKLKENVVLLCYEKSSDFCHRHLVAKWLKEEFNIECEEVNFDSQLNERLF